MRALTPLLLAWPLLMGGPSVGDAQEEAFLVADLNRTEVQGSSTNLLATGELGGRFLFAASDPGHGHELWASDGTAGGTFLLRDLCPGPCHGAPGDFVRLGRRLYFWANDGAFGYELWTTDGTPAGTRLVRDICPGPCSAGSRGTFDPVVLGGHIYFNATDGAHGAELWRSDGSRGGTEMVADLCPGACGFSPLPLVATDDRLFFLRALHAGGALWVTDGTAGGTEEVLAGCGSCTGATVFGDRIFFLNRTLETGRELWTSDGTAAGSGLFADLCPGPCSSAPSTEAPVVFGGKLYFAASAVKGRVAGLWRTGADPATLELAVGFPTISIHSPHRLTAFDGALYFAAGGPGVTRELFRSDGTAAGTTVVRAPEQIDFNDVVTDLAPAVDRLYFVVNRQQVWVAAGGGATHLVSLPPGDLTPDSVFTMVAAGSRLYFGGWQDHTRFELWTSDGTPAGTHLVRDIYRDPGSSSPGPAAALGNRLIFAAEDDLGADGLWTTDGSAAGTVPLGVGPSSAVELFGLDGRLLYAASQPGDEAGLWQTDGTPAGTRRLALEPAGASELARIGERLFFSADRGEGTEPWVSDLTEEGTFQLGDLFPGSLPGPSLPPPGPASSWPRSFVSVDGNALFIATGPGAGRELWTSDGTSAGTRLLADLCPGPCSSDIDELVPFAGAVTFAATDGAHGRELWASDGTADGTRMIVDLVAGEPGSDPRELTPLGGRLLFFAAAPGGGDALWASDGTAAGTALVVELALDGLPSYVGESLPVGDRLFFVLANEATGPELWASDGTAAGTRMVREVHPGPLGAYPGGFAAAGDRLVFAADDGTHGREPWESDGTAAGTRRLADAAPGAASASPTGLTATPSRLFFSADDGARGRELWALPYTAADPCPSSDEVLCLGGGRFEVRVSWRNQHAGGTEGLGHRLPYAEDTGFFWFFDRDSSELAVKIVDGRRLNGHFWVFHAGLSDVEYTLEVQDRETGAAWSHHNPPGSFCGGSDTEALPALGPGTARRGGRLGAEVDSASPWAHAQTRAAEPPEGSCTPGAETLCLLDGRIQVEVAWRNQHAGGTEGPGRAVTGSDETGAFWFFDSGVVELLVKIVDGRRLNGKLWLFAGSLSDVEYWLTVTDTVTGAQRTYHNPPGQLCGVVDTGAL